MELESEGMQKTETGADSHQNELLNVLVLWVVQRVPSCLPFPPNASIQHKNVRPTLLHCLVEGCDQIFLVVWIFPEENCFRELKVSM